MPVMGMIWLIAVIVFIILEAVTYQIVSIWFVFGAAGGLIAYLLGADFYWQLGIFIAVSAVLLAVFRPLSMKLIKKPDLKTNAESLIGKNVLITREVSNIKGTGQGRLNGMVWTVRGDTDEVIPAGETARVKKIEGVKLIAERVG